jgi:hypothetical protein
MRGQREIVREFEVELPLDDCERWLRSPDSRMCFPGAHEVKAEAKDSILKYAVTLRAPGSRSPAELLVEEHLTPPTSDAGGRAFTSTQVWRWPGGALASAWATYELASASGNQTHVRLRQEYVLPGSAMQELINDSRFRKSTERAFDAYVASLRDRAPAPLPPPRATRPPARAT